MLNNFKIFEGEIEMIVYRVDYHYYGRRIATWFSNKLQAHKFQLKLKREMEKQDPEDEREISMVYDIEKYEIPTDKKGLITWLNGNFQNGDGVN